MDTGSFDSIPVKNVPIFHEYVLINRSWFQNGLHNRQEQLDDIAPAATTSEYRFAIR
jgi:hypothetical protein